MTHWTIEPRHTALEFAVRHMTITFVRGRFQALSGSVETDDSGALVSVTASIDANSLTTNDEQRDGHLKSPLFFDTAQFPTLEFKSTDIAAKGEHTYRVTGDLTMHGLTRPITLEVETAAAVLKDGQGLTRTGASASGQLSRKAWGLTWNNLLESGEVILADEVNIILNIEAVIPPPT